MSTIKRPTDLLPSVVRKQYEEATVTKLEPDEDQARIDRALAQMDHVFAKAKPSGPQQKKRNKVSRAEQLRRRHTPSELAKLHRPGWHYYIPAMLSAAGIFIIVGLIGMMFLSKIPGERKPALNHTGAQLEE